MKSAAGERHRAVHSEIMLRVWLIRENGTFTPPSGGGPLTCAPWCERRSRFAPGTPRTSWSRCARYRSGYMRLLIIRRTLVRDRFVLEKHAAHLVHIIGDHGVQAWPRAAPAACGDDGDAVPGLLRSELVARELGRQLAQFRWHANHSMPTGIMIGIGPGGLSWRHCLSSRRCA